MAARNCGGAGNEILVIEDEVRNARLLASALTTAGFEVTTAASGLRGLALASSGRYNLVILDLIRPDVDEVSILADLIDRVVGTQVLVLSAVGDVHLKVRCLEVGACDYMTKPFDLPELVARVRLRINERRETSKETRVLRQDDFVLDLRKRTVQSERGTVSLSTREFVLLEYLMRSAGEVCARKELLEHVWGYTFDPATNVLDVCVARLRNKLGGTSIQTTRNVGYAFVGA
jgi:DNA-binding response OmpR family regulator